MTSEYTCEGCGNPVLEENGEDLIEERGGTWHLQCLTDYHGCDNPECGECYAS